MGVLDGEGLDLQATAHSIAAVGGRGLIVFLLSGAAPYVTGIDLFVDGGAVAW